MKVQWPSEFEIGHPVPGATLDELAQFQKLLFEPLSAEEISKVNASQSNPFVKTSALYKAWQPFDASSWKIPAGDLPEEYLSFLRYSNGGEFGSGGRWFQFFPLDDSNMGVRAMLLAYHIPQYWPNAIPFALDGNGWFYAFDMRSEPIDGSYPIYCSHAGNLGWSEDESALVASTFIGACRGTTDIQDLVG